MFLKLGLNAILDCLDGCGIHPRYISDKHTGRDNEILDPLFEMFSPDKFL